MYINEVGVQNTVTDGYPFSLPIIRSLAQESKNLKLEKSITFLSGENGSGKSTLLEAIAVAYGINPEGGTKNFNFSTFDSHSVLHKYITLIRRGEIPKTAFFLRAENYYNIASEIENLNLSSFYGMRPLHEMSHGEGMLSIVTNRFTENGLYILDEPESGLSVSRQMSLLKEIILLAKKNCQFIIATHSPILLAAPEATIYNITAESIDAIGYRETEAYQVMKLFLDDPDRMIHYLMDE